jgi:antitoxin YefM
MIQYTNYTRARAGFAGLIDKVINDREIVVIQRRGAEDVAVIAAAELESLMENAYLLRSPANAKRLYSAVEKALKGKGRSLTPNTLRRMLGKK